MSALEIARAELALSIGEVADALLVAEASIAEHDKNVFGALGRHVRRLAKRLDAIAGGAIDLAVRVNEADRAEVEETVRAVAGGREA